MGEWLLNGFFLTSSLALAAGRPRGRWLAWVGASTSTLGWIAMLRNLTPRVAPVAALNNVVLPVWMLTLGVVLVAQGRALRTHASDARRHDGSASPAE